jgi:hypothetical protein
MNGRKKILRSRHGLADNTETALKEEKSKYLDDADSLCFVCSRLHWRRILITLCSVELVRLKMNKIEHFNVYH